MPLKNGKSQATIEKNTAQLIKDGYSPPQAYAIAHHVASKSKPKGK